MMGKVKDALLHFKRAPFTRQKMPFYIAKDALLHCKRCSFTLQKSIYCFAHADFLLHYKHSPSLYLFSICEL